MKIIYITTSLEANDYIEFNKQWSVSLNPSNQNFHNKIIRSLAIYNPVEVISLRPFSRQNCNLKKLKKEEKTVGNITYHYLKITRNKFLRLISTKRQSKSIVKDLIEKDDIIITDTINPKCVSVTNALQKKFKIPALGICTDSPSNITGTTRAYTMYLLKHCYKLDGFITLTEGLNLLYNPNNKKHLTIEGIVEGKEIEEKPFFEGKYIFFGGALLPRYGVYNLIDAFKKIEDKDISLLICGHHADEEKIQSSIKDDSRINFLGTLPVNDVLVYEKYALANINPRPFTQDLDRLSVPSKTLEYLASGTITISVRNTELEKYFENSAIWAKSGEVDDLYDAMKQVIKMSEEKRNNIAKEAKNTANSLYSLENVGKKITDFSLDFIK